MANKTTDSGEPAQRGAQTDGNEPKTGVEMLLEDQNVVTLHFFEHPEYPRIDYSMWRSPQKAENEISELIDYIDSPAIEDVFGKDHTSRKKWHAKLEDKEVKKILKSDPLQANAFHTPEYHLDNLKKGYKGPNKDKLLGMCAELYDDFPDGRYSELGFQTKLVAANNIKQRVYDILVFLSEQKK